MFVCFKNTFAFFTTEEQLLRQKCATLQRHHADYWVELADCYQRTAVKVWSAMFRMKTNERMELNEFVRSYFSERKGTTPDLSEINDCQTASLLTSDVQFAQATIFTSQHTSSDGNDRDDCAVSTHIKTPESTNHNDCSVSSDHFSVKGSNIYQLEKGKIHSILKNTCELFRPYFHQKACMPVTIASGSTSEASYSASRQQLQVISFHPTPWNLSATCTSTVDTASEACGTSGQHLEDSFWVKCELFATETGSTATLSQFALQLDSLCDVFVSLVTDQSGKCLRSVLERLESADLQGHLLLVGLLMLSVIASLLWAR